MGDKQLPAVALIGLWLVAVSIGSGAGQNTGSTLQMYVDEVPQIPRVLGYTPTAAGAKPRSLTIGMYKSTWKFHRDLPAAPVFVYGTSAENATFPGPTIEALQGVPTSVTWENHLPQTHILPWDPTVPTAIPKNGGVPAVVHLHGGIHAPAEDGSAFAWFTAGFAEKGPAWSKTTYTYPNIQNPGNLWYHDHALGLTRASLLAGLLAPYVIRNPRLEGPFTLPSGPDFDRHLVIADRSFNTDGSIYMNFTGNVPSVHPQWQPEYFGDAITVNGKAWPFLKVQRRKYRFRIINASNARYLRLALSDGTQFTVVGSDTNYLRAPVNTPTILMSPAEIYDVVLDFSRTTAAEIEVTNDAPYPYPSGTPATLPVSKVLKFIVLPGPPTSPDDSRITSKLMSSLPVATTAEATVSRFIVLYENTTASGEPLNLHINGKRLEDPVTETPKPGSTEQWEVINLTGDNHPFHTHLGSIQAVRARQLLNFTAFTDCMLRVNDAVKCNIQGHINGAPEFKTPYHERTWKNVVKIEPGTMTTVIIKFNLIVGNAPYPFDATAEPGYVYHCHILDHEDNAMIRPLKLIK